MTGCLIVLRRANTTASEPIPDREVEETEAQRQILRRKRASIILYSQVNSVAPTITATAAAYTRKESSHRGSLPREIVRSLQLGDEERYELEDISSGIRRSLLQRSLTAPMNEFRRLSEILMKDYGTMESVDEEEE